MTTAPTTPRLADDAQRGSHSVQRLVGHSEPKTHENKTLNELHLFAGGGGGILGGMLLGHRTVCAVELKPYCRDDVRTFAGRSCLRN